MRAGCRLGLLFFWAVYLFLCDFGNPPLSCDIHKWLFQTGIEHQPGPDASAREFPDFARDPFFEAIVGPPCLPPESQSSWDDARNFALRNPPEQAQGFYGDANCDHWQAEDALLDPFNDDIREVPDPSYLDNHPGLTGQRGRCLHGHSYSGDHSVLSPQHSSTVFGYPAHLPQRSNSQENKTIASSSYSFESPTVSSNHDSRNTHCKRRLDATQSNANHSLHCNYDDMRHDETRSSNSSFNYSAQKQYPGAPCFSVSVLSTAFSTIPATSSESAQDIDSESGQAIGHGDVTRDRCWRQHGYFDACIPVPNLVFDPYCTHIEEVQAKFTQDHFSSTGSTSDTEDVDHEVEADLHSPDVHIDHCH